MRRPAWPHGQHVPGPHDWQQGRGSTRNPPPWAPELEDSYPFRTWVLDAVTWCLSTDVDEQRKGSQLELALGSIARDLVREIDINTKIAGGTVQTDQGP